MALRDQPYLPLYVQDFMTDEKLAECSAESTGVYIRVMCLMHKSEEYGTILLQQKFKQNPSTCQNFAEKLDNHLPYKVDVIFRSLVELVENGVLTIEGDRMVQRRMIRDFAVSNARSEAGKKGGFATANSSAKCIANTEYEYEDEIQDKKESEEREERLPYKTIIDYLNLKAGTEYKHTIKKTKDCIRARFNEDYVLDDFCKVIDTKVAEWNGGEMQKFLRPETLFSNKFEGYLNQKNMFVTKYEAKLSQSKDGGGFQM